MMLQQKRKLQQRRKLQRFGGETYSDLLLIGAEDRQLTVRQWAAIDVDHSLMKTMLWRWTTRA